MRFMFTNTHGRSSVAARTEQQPGVCLPSVSILLCSLPDVALLVGLDHPLPPPRRHHVACRFGPPPHPRRHHVAPVYGAQHFLTTHVLATWSDIMWSVWGPSSEGQDSRGFDNVVVILYCLTRKRLYTMYYIIL